MNLQGYLQEAVRAVTAWEETWGPVPSHPALAVDPDALATAFAAYTDRLGGNYPFFHPRYAGQMLKPPHPAAVAAYVAAMLINPNNHALDGGPPTAEMEKEAVRALAGMFGLPDDGLGHLTSSGTIANLEALWIAREERPGKAVAFSEEAHYTHERMCGVLGVEPIKVSADAAGRLRLDALEDVLRSGRVGTVVLTAGTTGVGAVDPIADALTLRDRYGVRLHVDAAYGGFYTLLADDAGGGAEDLEPATRRHFQAIAACDSVVVDPHKHGLQPYGCGAVLFRDAAVGKHYRHDSPYTYFTSDALHLGEISLECSRAGAAAGAFWLTLQVLPLAHDRGLGPVLAAARRAACTLHTLLADDPAFLTPLRPELDIVAYLPAVRPLTASAVDAASAALFDRAMHDGEDPVFTSVFRLASDRLAALVPGLDADQPHTRILRSVLMKPEHEAYVDHLHARLRHFAASSASL